MTDVGVRNLSAAIIRQAMEDYNSCDDRGYYINENHERTWRAQSEWFLRSGFASRMADAVGMLPELIDWLDEKKLIKDGSYI